MSTTWTYKETETTTIGELAEAYLLEKRVDQYSERTLEYYSEKLRLFASLAGNGKQIAEVSHADVRKYLNYHYERGCGANTVRLYIAVLQAFFSWLKQGEVIAVAPTDKISMPRKLKTMPRFLSEEQIGRLLKFTGRGYDGYRLGVIVNTFAGTGLRVSELCALDVSDVCFATETLNVIGKGSKERIVPLDEILVPELKRWLGVRKKYLRGRELDALFPTRVYRRPTRNTIYDQIRNLGQRAGITPISPHVLRHSFASFYMANGGKLRELQSILGHGSISATEVYLHTSARLIKEDLRRASPLKGIRDKLFTDP